MPRVLRTSKAEQDSAEIWLTISEDNVSAADRVWDALKAAFELLRQHPLAGRRRDELGSGIRSYPVGNYVIFYQVTTDAVIVVRVLHGAMDVPEL